LAQAIDHNPALYADGLRQQGMLQLFHDFCLPNRIHDLTRVATRLAMRTPETTGSR
jgi:hypothetical protein